MTPQERNLEQLSHKINARGVPVDIDLVEDMINLDQKVRLNYLNQMNTLTGLKNGNSTMQLMGWFKDHDVNIPDLRKQTVRAWVDKLPEGSNERQVMQLRKLLASTASKKWSKFKQTTNAKTGAVHSMFSYLGASRTGRWAGRQVQLHNMAQGWPDADIEVEHIRCAEPEDLEIIYPSAMDCLSQTVRTAISAPKGQIFSVADLSSIESRVVGWLANCTRINETFAEGKDSYRDFATLVFNKPYSQVTKEERGFCKPPVLGCSYMLGWRGLIAYAEGFGQDFTETQAKNLVSTWRETFYEVPMFWEWIKGAVMKCIRTGESFNRYSLKIERDKHFLRIKLPSGRYLYYHKPEIIMKQPPWEGDKIPAISYMGREKFTNKWQRISCHAGGLTENVVQAIARDILGYHMLEMDKVGMDIFLHVHDEVGVVDKDERLSEMIAIMRIPPEWAEGLLLDADGFTCKRYHK